MERIAGGPRSWSFVYLMVKRWRTAKGSDMRNVNRATGPGPHTLDGSSVELYKILPHFGEADIIHRALGDGATILELGAGVGRVTHPLLALGHRVTAVDFSAEMLQEIHGAETVLADISELRLSQRFDGVVLASTLINVVDDSLRHDFLATCEYHVAATGRVLIECHSESLLDRAIPGVLSDDGEVSVSWVDVRRDGETVTGTLEHRHGEQAWTQSFSARFLDEQKLTADLEAAGLVFERWLNERHSWFAAVKRIAM